jgi:hypothetical protein
MSSLNMLRGDSMNVMSPTKFTGTKKITHSGEVINTPGIENRFGSKNGRGSLQE